LDIAGRHRHQQRTVGGGIGGRDSLTFQGYPFTVLEAQGIAGDWSSWRVYVGDETARR
jgi:hypothetical protein